MTERASLISYLATTTIQPLVRKKLFGKPYIVLGELIFFEHRLFELSMLLGYRFRDRFDTFVKLFSTPGGEDTAIAFLESDAKERLDNLVSEPTMLLDVFYLPELKRLGLPILGESGDVLEGLKQWEAMAQQRVPADGVWQSVTMASTSGIAFGSTYPKLTEELWMNSFGKPGDAKSWHQARQYGLDIPETPSDPISLEDGIDSALEVL